MSVVGLDFGTQNAVIASAGRGGVDVILNGNSQRLNPCMVGFQDSRYMGEDAQSKSTSNYKNTVTCMKRLVGLSFTDPRAQKEMAMLPLTFVPSKNGGVAVEVSYSGLSGPEDDGDSKVAVPIEHVAGMMVQHMGEIASKAAGDGVTVSDWVVAVPGYYTDAQKRSFLSGCEVVGITNVLRLMHDHTATALAYGIFKDIRKEFDAEKPTNVMFLDMGYANYSATICTFVPGKLIVKSAQFDADLGGRDFDILIAKWISKSFADKYGSKLSTSDPSSKPKTMIKMLAAAQKAKKTLSPAGVKEARINMECLLDDYDFNGSLKADEYEQMCEPLLARLEGPIRRALAEAQMTPADLASIEIVGGATRVSCVKQRLASILGLNASGTNNGLSTTMNADEAVARGCALQSAILSPRFKVKPYEIVEAQPYPVQISWDATGSTAEGVEVSNGDDAAATSNRVVMFERNSNFPVTKRVSLRQRAGEFSVSASYANASVSPSDVATFVIKAPSDVAGGENKVRVNVKNDVHGIVHLSSAQMITEVIEEEPAAEDKKEEDAAMKTEDGAAENASDEKKDVPPPAAEEEKKKKKTIKTNLEFRTTRPLEWSKKEMDAMNELEVKMANADRVIRETADKRNELESYIYSMRDRVIGDLAPYCNDADKASFENALESTENWLYEDGFDAAKSVYADKLKGLEKFGGPIERRLVEATGRAAAVSTLQSTAERYKQWLNTAATDEKYAHITDEEKSNCHKKCDDTSSWMYDMLDKQGGLPATADPAVTVGQINLKVQELVNFVSPIMNKPKPVPKKEEPEKEEEAKKESENGEESKMDVDTDAAATGGGEAPKENGTNGDAASVPMDVD